MVESVEVALRPCPLCRAEISAAALRCRYCQGAVRQKKTPFEDVLSKGAAVLGAATACLGLFYAVREGYHFVHSRQERRQSIRLHLASADRLERIDHLEFALAGARKALALDPDDWRLRRRVFLLQARILLREADFLGVQLPDDQAKAIPEMVPDGFGLLFQRQSAAEKAEILVTLGRLLPWDPRWGNAEEVTALFDEAVSLAPEDPEVLYRAARWFSSDKEAIGRAEELFGKASALAPEDALFCWGKAEFDLDRKDVGAALRGFWKAAQLKPFQKDLDRVRAANEASRSLRAALREGMREAKIGAEDFFGLSYEERAGMLEGLLIALPSDREVKFIAAEFYEARKEWDKAEETLRAVLGDFRRYAYRSDRIHLERLARVMEKRGGRSEDLRALRGILGKQ